MLGQHKRLAIAGVAAATAIALPTAALASGPGSPSGKPTPSAPAASASKSPPSSERAWLAALAASAGISVSQLEAGLVAAKAAGGDTAAGVTAFAASTGVSQATAQRIIDTVFKASPSGKQPPPASGPGGKSARGPQQSQLNSLAASAGITVSRLEAGLVAMKQAMRAGGNTGGIAAFAAATGVSHATAQRIVNAVTGG